MTDAERARHQGEIALALARLLRQSREGADMTQIELAARIHRDRASIARWECAMHLKGVVDYIIALEACGQCDKFVDALATITRNRVPSR